MINVNEHKNGIFTVQYYLILDTRLFIVLDALYLALVISKFYDRIYITIPRGGFVLIHMRKKAYKYRAEKLDIRKKLLSAEANRLSGAKTYTIAELSERLRGLINGVQHDAFNE